MKFQKDNSNVVITQAMKDAVEQRKQAQIEKAQERAEAAEKTKELMEKREEIKLQMSEIMKPVYERMMAYGDMDTQFDKLWHDIDQGRIQADKTSANSWYMSIKDAKTAIPLANNAWRQQLDELDKQFAGE